VTLYLKQFWVITWQRVTLCVCFYVAAVQPSNIMCDLLFTESFTMSVCISKGEMARLRLQAGCCMLKLAQEPVYADAIKLEQFQTMALLASVSNLSCIIFVHSSYKAIATVIRF